MQMDPVDNMGSLYSSKGLRFGGFQTVDFIAQTELLEARMPNIRRTIVAEAHYLVMWLHHFSEVGFLIGIFFFHSILHGIIFFCGAYFIELFRFYSFGASPIIPKVSKLWNLVKLPAFIGAIIVLWNPHLQLALILIVFVVLQLWFILLTTLVMLPVRIIFARHLYIRVGHIMPGAHNMEAMALQLSIQRWQQKRNLVH